MLNRLTITNFKRFGQATIDLGDPVVFVGPNNSGKTTALQSIALWETGLRLWLAKYRDRVQKGEDLGKRPGVTVNRRDLAALPVPSAQLLWHEQHVRRGKTGENGRGTENIRIGLEVEGVTADRTWTCGMEFDYANDESFYCRPLGLATGQARPVPVVEMGELPTVAFLPPMSGLKAEEDKLELGSILSRIGQGMTADVLRNLCHRLTSEPGLQPHWETLVDEIDRLFGVRLLEPVFHPGRGLITMGYTEHGGTYDLSSAGRGLQQVTLLLAFMLGVHRSVLLLDEPDAHLEILRQRQIYEAVTRIARHAGSQVICATHSEVVLDEAAGSHSVVAFVGKPHRIDQRSRPQVAKALKDISFADYYQAETKRWVLYLEGSTDLRMLQHLARRLTHSAAPVLGDPFVHYLNCNDLTLASRHFHGLKEASPALRGLAIIDRLPAPPQVGGGLDAFMWPRREIENYLCQPSTLKAWARAAIGGETGDGQTTLFAAPAEQAMITAIADNVPPRALRDDADAWWTDTKVSDEFLPRVFDAFFAAMSIPNRFHKTSYAELVPFIPDGALAPELRDALDLVAGIAAAADRMDPAQG